MKTNLRVIVISLFLVFGIISCKSVTDTNKDIVDQAAQNVMAKYKVPGMALAIIENNEISYVGTYGLATPTNMVTKETIFNVASLTKPLFALSYLHLVQDGMADLDEPLMKYWIDPDVKDDPRLEKLTARLVLSHQSGFPNWRGSNKLRFLFTPGDRHEYSGEGYQYLRMAMENKTGLTYTELMNQNVFAPLGMNHTILGWSDEISENLANGFDEEGELISSEHLKNRVPNAAASTFTTIEDYARFAAWVSDGASLTPEVFKEMSTLQSVHPNPIEFYGLGWRLTQMSESRTILEHDGREPGVRTLIMVDPVKDRAFVLLTNSSNGELVVPSMVKAIWPDGGDVLAQRDEDIWVYLAGIPEPAVQGMLGFISQSPSFVMKLLYAAKAGIVDPGSISSEENQELDQLIEDLVYGNFVGDISAEQVNEVFLQLGSPTEQGFHFYNLMTVDQVHQWMESMRALN
ncbi:serine hydrolase domain-containing protein [Spirochaeta cellobiosiphila]|uniref:serine hydrolase domain-containing protein n=1 Tax=Spirochaeta cellobiosiphila TaxID=504483 RepID=UPI00041022F5|nr:serine hydrolase domain-containing protein [Spirochaeta cellobiosiphila]